MVDTDRIGAHAQAPSKGDAKQAMAQIRASAEQEEDRQRARRWRLLAVASGLALLISLPASIGAALIASDSRDQFLAYQAAEQVTGARQQGAVDRAAAQLDDINQRLVAQGKPPVPPPGAGEDSTDAIARVVLAQVLAQIPAGPDAAQVGGAIAGRVTDNLLGTTRSQVAEQAATYLQANPPAPGRPPTLAEIQAAVDRAYTANPPPPGRDGAPGTPGADSTVQGPQGVKGDRGDKGDKGDPGPACPPGTQLAPVLFADGQQGQGCVIPAPSTETPGPTETLEPPP